MNYDTIPFTPIQKELSKLLQEQQDAVNNHSDPLVIEQNNKEIWALRNKYACGSTWGKDPAFDKWWVKQVAKARNLNTIRQIVIWFAIGAIAIFIILGSRLKMDNTPANGDYSPDPPNYIESDP
jgi:hypothetical protein